MLPFLVKQKNNVGISTEIRKPDKEESSTDYAMEACAKDILDAVSANDHKALASALRSLLEVSRNEEPSESIGD